MSYQKQITDALHELYQSREAERVATGLAAVADAITRHRRAIARLFDLIQKGDPARDSEQPRTLSPDERLWICEHAVELSSTSTEAGLVKEMADIILAYERTVAALEKGR